MIEVRLSEQFMDEFYDKYPEYKDVDYGWCDCEEQHDAFFHNDYDMPMQSCVEKHHYHCSVCMGLVQIG